MAAPNIVNVTTIYGKTVGAALTTSTVDILTNSAASGKVFKVNTILVANTDTSVSASATVTWYDASATATYSIAKTVSVPANSTLVVLDKISQIYLEEGDKISSLASAASKLEIIVSYDDIS